MPVDPSVQWLASAGEAAVKADLDQAAASLRLLLQGVEAEPATIDSAIGQVLEICAETGPGALQAPDARSLLYPALLYLQRTGTSSLFEGHLRVIGRRADLRSSENIDELLRELAPQMDDREEEEAVSISQLDADTGVATEVSDLLTLLERGAPPAVGEIRDRALLTHVSSAWTQIRGRVEPEARATSDVYLLRSVLLLRAPLPVGLAEAIARDETVWKSTAIGGFAVGLAEPLRADDLGMAQSALLNARLRALRPRLFLRAPDALVIEPVGAKFDSAAIEAALLDEVSAPLLRCLTTIEEENSRAGERRPRKTVFRELASYVAQVLERLGSHVEPHVGEVIAFDPERHASAVPLEPGVDVRTVVPGLIDRKTRSVRIRALVEPCEADRSSEPTAGDDQADAAAQDDVKRDLSEPANSSVDDKGEDQLGTGES